MTEHAVFHLTAQPHPLRDELLRGDVEVGCTLEELGAGNNVLAVVDGAVMQDLDYMPAAGQQVILRTLPAGFVDDFLGPVGFLLNPFLYIGDALAGVFLDALAGLIPLPSIEQPDVFKPFGNVASTSNRVQPFGPIPRLYGTHRIFPPLAAKHYTEQAGDAQYLRMLFCLGYGPLTVDEASIRIGETLLSEYEHEKEILLGEVGDPPLTLFSRNVAETALSDAFNLDGHQVVRSTGTGAREISLDFAAPALLRRNDEGKKRWVKVGFRVEMRATGSGDPWTEVTPAIAMFSGDGGYGAVAGTVGDVYYLFGQDAKPYRVNLLIRPASVGQYDIRVTRTSMQAQNVGQQVEPNDIASEFNWTVIRSFGSDIAQNVPSGLSYLALRIKITDQLGSVVSNLSLVATSRLQTWNGSAWVLAATSNPAWIYRDIARGTANARPLAEAKVNDDELKAWALECTAAGREFNGIFDGRTTVFEALKSVTLAGRGSFQISGGKYGVVRDVAGLVPVQMFTPRNGWDFNGARAYERPVHGYKIKFKDRDADWEESERIVYADGYSEDGAGATEVATDFEALTLFGFTDAEAVWKEGRYRLAVKQLRPETFTWTADVEHLVCRRGSVVSFQHDAILLGLGSGRIKSMGGGAITLDETFTIESGKTYQVQIRKDTAVTATATVTNAPGVTATLTLSGGVPVGVQVGDLVAFGESGLVTQQLLITGITPSDELRAQITAVPYSPDIFDAETGTIPDYDPLVTRPPVRPPAPVILNVLSGIEAGVQSNTGSINSRIVVSYLFPANEVPVRYVEGGIRRADELQFSATPRQPNSGTYIFDLVDAQTDYVIQLRGVSPSEVAGPYAEQAVPATDAVPNALGGLTLIEQTNNPATPNRDQSTVIATVAPPSPVGNYSHAIVEYRLLGQADWGRVGPTDAGGQAHVVLTSDGRIYEFRARAVSDTGYEDTGGPVTQITLSLAGVVPGVDPDAGAPTDAALDVTNLRILGELAAVTTFNGSDASVEWNAVTPPMDQTLRDYRVRITETATGNVMRYQYVVANRYTYTLFDNLSDSAALGYTSARRAITVQVLARTSQGFVSDAPAVKAISNPAPVLPGDFAITTYGSNLEYRFSRPSDGDFARAEIYASLTNGFTPGPGNKIYEGTETNPVIIGNFANGTWYSRVLLYDAFGAGTISAQYSTVVTSTLDDDITPPTAPTGLSLSSAVQTAALYTASTLTATWTAGTDNSGVLFTEIEYWITADSTKRTVDRTPFATYTISPVKVGANYSLRVRSVDYSGNVSAWSTTATHTIAGDTTAPANVSGATATAGLDKIVLEYTLPADADFLTVLIYRGTSSGFTANSASQIGEFRGDVFVDAEVTAGVNYYYKFATKDSSGNVSTASSAIGPVSSLKVTSGNVGNYIADLALQASQIATGAITEVKIADLAITELKIDTNAVTTAKIATSAITTAKIASDAVTEAKIAASAVTATQIATDAVTSPKILAGAIVAGKIAVAAVTAGTIAANAVTAGTIEAGAVTAGKIAANAVTATTIAADAVTAGKIAANAVEAGNIAANAVTAGTIAANAVTAGTIAANAVTAGKIAANAVTTANLVVGDFTNLAENADFELGDVGWSFLGSGWSIVNNPAQAHRGSWVAQRTGASTSSIENAFLVHAAEGDTFYASAFIKFVSGVGSGGRVRIYALNASLSLVGTFDGSLVPASTTSYTASTLTAVMPANTSYMRVFVSGVSMTSGTMYADSVGLFRVAGSALIADAAIITAKIADAAITNAKINDLDAGKITAGFIAAARIQAGTVTADKLNVTTLSAITADLGTVTAGTITGATTRTAASGARVELTTANGVRAINASAVTTAQINVDGSGFLGASPGSIQWSTAGAITFAGNITVASGNLNMTGGAIYAGKSTYASSTAGYWLGWDSGTAKLKIGASSNSLDWNGSSLTVTGVIQTALTGQRVVLTSGNETQFIDSDNSLAVSIGINALGGDNAYLLAGLSSGNATQLARIGVAGRSGTSAGVYGLSNSSFGVIGLSTSSFGVYGTSLSSRGVYGVSTSNHGVVGEASGATPLLTTGGGGVAGVVGEADSGGTGVFGRGDYAMVAQQVSNTVGGSVLVKGQSSNTSAPTHTAEAGTLCVRYINTGNGGTRLYMQTAGGYGGTGNNWVQL